MQLLSVTTHRGVCIFGIATSFKKAMILLSSSLFIHINIPPVNSLVYQARVGWNNLHLIYGEEICSYIL